MNIMISCFELYPYIVSSKCRMVYLLSPCDSWCVFTIILDSDVKVEDQFPELEQGHPSGDA